MNDAEQPRRQRGLKVRAKRLSDVDAWKGDYPKCHTCGQPSRSAEIATYGSCEACWVDKGLSNGSLSMRDGAVVNCPASCRVDDGPLPRQPSDARALTRGQRLR